MRLGCPNCGALYEVADAAIPASGRDVACSACDHRWLQHPARAEAAPRPTPAESAPAATPEQLRPRPTDPAVLQILREEAEREMSKRRAAAQARAAKPAPAQPSPADTAPPRRTLLPEIEDPSLSREPQPKGSAVVVHTNPERPAGGFLTGLLFALALALAAIATYLWAPQIAAAVPALSDPLASYTAAVDNLRLTLEGALR